MNSFWENRVVAQDITHIYNCATGNTAAVYLFWPRLNIGVRENSMNFFTYRFIESHFLNGRPLFNRLFWRFCLLLPLLPIRVLPPIRLNVQLQGDIFYLADCILEFNLSTTTVARYYSANLPTHVKKATYLLADCWPDNFRQDPVIKNRIYSPLATGVPLNSCTPKIHDAACSKALEQIGFLQKEHKQHVQVNAYVNELIKNLDTHKVPGYLISLITKLSKNSTIVTLTISHGDLKKQNILWDGADINLIDWELADLRSMYHDLMNLIIHPAFTDHYPLKSIHQILCKKLIWQWILEKAQHQTPEDIPSESEIKTYFFIALIEKYVMYVLSGRWSNNTEACVHTWLTGIELLNKEFNLGINNGR